MAAGFAALEWLFVVFVSAMTGAAGLFSLYVVIQLFRSPARRRPRVRW